MLSCIVLVIACSVVLSDKVVVRPDMVDPFISTELTSDPRGYNEINFRNKWRLRALASPNLRFKDWALTLSLDGEQFGFAKHSDHSVVSTEFRGFCTSMSCDTLFALQIGKNQMVLFQVDLQSFDVSIYPKCGGDVMNGNAADLIKNLDDYPKHYQLADALHDAKNVDFTPINNQARKFMDGFPVSFEFINDDINNQFTINFSSEQHPNRAQCSYNAVNTGKDLKLFMTPGWKNQNLIISSIVVEGEGQKSSQAQKLEYFEETHWSKDITEGVLEEHLYNHILHHFG